MSESVFRVLVIGYVWPEPNSSAAGSRMMQLLQSFLRQGWQIHFASPAQPTEHQVDLEALNIVCHRIRLNCVSFDHFLTQCSPECVLFDRFMMEEQFGWRVEQYAPQALRILNTEDLHSLRHARHQALKQTRDQSPEDMHSELAIREIAAIFRSDLTLMISAVETALLQERFQVPAEQLFTVPFMLEPNSAEEIQQRLPFSARQDFISIGNFRHAPNWDAVLYLKQTLWPKIRQRLPEARLHIYGAYPPPKATQLHQPAQGFLVQGWADDAKAVLGRTRVLLAPLRFGAGLKGKLVEAMQTGTPSVTTPVGAEGMDHHGAWAGAICAEDEGFINQAIVLYTQESTWSYAQGIGDRILETQFNRHALEPLCIERIVEHYHQRQVYRSKHFISQMMRHHSMKSTQYMAQWIEAKNKVVSD